MNGLTAQSVIQIVTQVVLTAIVGWLAHKLATARTEFKRFLEEHKAVLTQAQANSDAILKLNRRMERLERRRG